MQIFEQLVGHGFMVLDPVGKCSYSTARWGKVSRDP